MRCVQCNKRPVCYEHRISHCNDCLGTINLFVLCYIILLYHIVLLYHYIIMYYVLYYMYMFNFYVNVFF